MTRRPHPILDRPNRAPRQHPRGLRAGLLTGLAAVGIVLLGPSCDNPSCVFGGDCFGVGGSGTDSPFDTTASLPVDHQWVLNGAPVVEDAAPNGPGQHPETPILVVFSESIAPESLDPLGAGGLDGGDIFGDGGDTGDDLDGGLDGGLGGDLDGGTDLPGSPLELVGLDAFTGEAVVVNTAPPVLVGDGRVAVLLPASPLAAGEYQVRFGNDTNVRDLSGDSLVVPSDRLITTFTVAETAPAEPRVLLTFPPDASRGQSETGQIVVAFDRPMQAATVGGDGWSVTVDGDDPAIDPEPVPAIAGELGLGGLPLGDTDTRVFAWRSAEPITGVALPLGLSADVEVALSPNAAPILDEDGNELPATEFGFSTAAFGAPLLAQLTSMPSDAIGLANLGLDPDVPSAEERELEMVVALRGARGGDVVEVLIVGENRDGSGPVALEGSRSLSGSGAVDTTTLRLAQLPLVQGDDEPVAAFADGVVSFALRVVRSGVSSPVRLLDVEPLEVGLQEVLLDTTAPTLDDLIVPGDDRTLLRSNLRDLVVSGSANEAVGAVEVRVPSLGADNGALFPPALGVTEVSVPVDGETDPVTRFLFTAAPVALGVVDGADLPLEFEVRVFDRALNASPAVVASYVQTGTVGSAAFAPGDTLEVFVHDALEDLAPLEGVRVSVFSDVGDGVNYPFVDGALTDVAGAALVSTSPNPASRPVLVVSAPGFDVFTFHGVTAGRVDVPLRRIGEGLASVSGDVRAGSDRASVDLISLGGRLADSRRAEGALVGDTERALPWVELECTGQPLFGIPATCPFEAEPIRTGQLGAQSFFAGRFDLAANQFNTDTALQAFELLLPLPIASEGEATTTAMLVPQVFEETDPDAALAAQELEGVLLIGGVTDGLDFGNLVGDPSFTGEPIVAVEAVSPGVAGTVPVGFGNGFAQGNNWNVRAVHAGAAGVGGALSATGVLQPDLLLRIELRDADGNRSGRRPRVSELLDFGMVGSLQMVPVDVPAVLAPAGGNTGGAGFDVVFDDVLPDGDNGLYRVVLEDSSGRRWELYAPDRDGQMTERVRVFDGATAAATLAAGEIRCSVSAFAWTSFDPAGFLWTDIEREYGLFAEAAPVALSKP